MVMVMAKVVVMAEVVVVVVVVGVGVGVMMGWLRSQRNFRMVRSLDAAAAAADIAAADDDRDYALLFSEPCAQILHTKSVSLLSFSLDII